MEKDDIKYIQNLGWLSYNCAYIYFDEDGYTKKLMIDGEKFDGETMMQDFFEYTRNMERAVYMAREYDSFKEMGPHIDSFIIKYHPTWIAVRELAGFVKKDEKAIECISPLIDIRTYDEWIHDQAIAMGVTPPKNVDDKGNVKIKPDARMSIGVFQSSIDQDEMSRNMESEELTHPDYIAFNMARIIKKNIDEYRQARCSGKDQKELGYNYKNVSYKLGKDRFPIITMGAKKRKTEYDMRDFERRMAFYERFAKKNPNTIFAEQARELKKVFSK